MIRSRARLEDGRTRWGRKYIPGATGLWRARFRIPALVVGGIATLVLSCGDDSVGPTTSPPPPPAPVATTVTVNPGSASFTALGETARFTAEVRDQNGQVMAGAAVAWASSDASVAAVDASGLVTAAGNGTTTVTATAGPASGQAAVTVMQSAGSVLVSPSEATITPGDTLWLVAEAYDENGHRVEDAVFSWSSSDAGVARVDEMGLVTGVGEGMVRVRAGAGDASGTAEITVENPDRAALVALYEATDGPNWADNTNWLTDAPLGEWYGVATGALGGRVSHLDLGGKYEDESDTGERTPHGLKGSLPAELGDLANLILLNLEINELSGPIPPELGNLARLEWLELSYNELSGSIPIELGRLSNLRSLSIQFNDLSGSIPTELGDLSSLNGLLLGGNSLTGSIPPEMDQFPGLTVLALFGNELTGPIPPELGNLSSLRHLTLSNNRLTGPIPPELGDLSGLVHLTLNDNSLTGPIPPELGKLTGLNAQLNLYGNQLTGPIPRSWATSPG